MKHIMTIAVILISNTSAQDIFRMHEIGWEGGVRYMYRGLKMFSLGLVVSPSLNYRASEGSSASSIQINNDNENDEERSFYTGIQTDKEFIFDEIILFEPFSEFGYSFQWRKHYENDENIYLGNQRLRNGSRTYWLNGFQFRIGAKPGFLIKKRLKIYTSFGLILRYENTRSTANMNDFGYSNSDYIYNDWGVNLYGNTINFSSGIYISFLL